MSLSESSENLSTPRSPTGSSRKRTVSERKIQANRRNALRSTGPKTVRGKQIVSRNAIKHGLLAREVVITAGDGEESVEEFHELVEQLWDCYQPVGIVEETLVQTIATSMWRKARVIRAENGEIRERLDTLSMERLLQRSDQANLDIASSAMSLDFYRATNPADEKVSTLERRSVVQAFQSSLRGHPDGLNYLKVLLVIAKTQITSDGYISEKIRKDIFAAFSYSDYHFATACYSAGPSEAEMEEKPSEKERGKEGAAGDDRGLIVMFIDHQLKKIDVLREYAVQSEELALDSQARTFSLPPADISDKLLRYESHLDRQLYRAMDQLERLQRQRKGEKVPPPLNIQWERKG